jgi:chaperonin GroEL
MTRVATAPDAVRRFSRSLGPTLRAVAAAAGPKGRACLLDRDGVVERAGSAVAIVRAVAEERGSATLFPRLLREMLFEADRDLGDGTARLALLWGGLIRYGARTVAAGAPAPALADALIDLGARLAASLNEERIGILPDRDQLIAVALSAGGSAALAREIGGLLHTVGSEGGIEIIEGREPGLRSESGDGFVFEAAPISEAFAAAELDPAYFLVADENIDDFGPLIPLLEGFATRGKALVVVARDVSGAALQALVRNHRENGLRAMALRPAAVSQHAADVLEDLAIATGATLIADRFGTSLSALRPTMLGRAALFSLAHGRAVLHAPRGDRGAIATRRRMLLAEAERQKYLDLDRQRLEARAARLAGRWGRLHVFERTERDAKAIIQAAGRALASARSAATGGVLPGASVGLVRSFDRMPINRAEASDEVFSAAHQCLAAAVADLFQTLLGIQSFDAPSPRLPHVRPGALASALGLNSSRNIEIYSACLDPLPLTRSLVDRAISGAAGIIRLGAIMGS